MDNINVSNFLMYSHRNQFWIDFCDSLSEELQLFKESEVIPNKLFYDVDSWDDEEHLIQILNMMGYSINRILDSSLEFIKDEIKSLYYKVNKKASYNGYSYFYKLYNLDCKLYNVFFDGKKLISAVDYEKLLINFNTFNKYEYFNLVEPLYNFQSIQDVDIELDSYVYNLYLDSQDSWTLDNKLLSTITKHLVINYFPKELIVKDNKDYLVTLDYMNYLRSSSEYNRRATEVLHNGVNLSFICSNDGLYNTFSDDIYSIPSHKINNAITREYLGKNINVDPVYLDEYLEIDLDLQTIVKLDNEFDKTQAPSTEDMFYSICAGIGKKSLIPKEYVDTLFNYSIILFYFDFDEILYDVNTFQDFSTNNRVMTVNGLMKQTKDGIIGKSLYCDGTSTMGTVNNIILNSTQYTINFWIRGLDSEQTGITNSISTLDEAVSSSANTLDLDQSTAFELDTSFDKNVGICILQLTNFVKIYYDYINNKLYCKIQGSLDSVILESDLYLDNTDKQISLVINNTIALIYVNGILKFTADISMIGIYSGTYTLNVGSDTITYFKGDIDEIKMLSVPLDETTLLYTYNNKIGNYRFLENEVYSDKLSSREIKEFKPFFYINSFIRANTVLNEYLFIYKLNTFEYDFTANVKNIKRFSFYINYFNSVGNYKIYDNGYGELIGDSASGTIDYKTGDCHIKFFRILSIAGEVLATNISSFSTIITHKPILPTTAILKFTIGGTTYEVIDDGLGHFVDPTITSGNINYINGIISVTFNSLTTDGDVVLDYYYRYLQEPTVGQKIYCNYIANDGLNITEYGIKNNKGFLVAYATAPNVELYNNDSIFNNWFIYKW